MTLDYSRAAFWDARFKDEDYAYGEHPNDFLRTHATLFKKGDAVLSLAEGEGRNAVFLARQGCVVRGVDFSATGRKKALKLAHKHGVAIDYELGDLTEVDLSEARWEGIVSLFCHLSEKQRPALFQSVKRALKPGGFFLLESYNKKQLAYDTGGPKDPSHLPSLDELEHAFEDFDMVLAQDVAREVHEGQRHNGLSSVTQLIARKRA